ncbi:MAG: acyl-CoA dehydrogenase family protein, partial [Alphaproteobacteria bacterium]|nr:acyl-CoA dehydrogenase family protein [Alphaproteobacteria bacterium]
DSWREVPPIFDELKAKAKAESLWNLFMPPSEHDDEFFTSVGLSNVEYAPIAELMGRVSWATEVFNCMAPDTGNFEVLHRYGTPEQKKKYMLPLAEGETRSAFLMTEPEVASSDARNIRTEIRRDGDDYVINGHKWFSSGAGHPRCAFFIVMGKTDPDAETYRQQSMIIVPRHAPGVKIVRHLPVFGYDHAPHGHFEVLLENVRVPADHLILGEGRGFEIAQGRLGPGRIHHCMRNIATCEVALEKMVRRLSERKAFGKPIIEHSIWEQRIAEARTDIEMVRLLCLKAAYMMDTVGNKAARAEIAMIKVAAPRVAQRIVDEAIQAHGGGGVTTDFGLAELYANTRIVRLTDGPDEVHCRQIARLEAKKYKSGQA